MDTVNRAIFELVRYGVATELLTGDDAVYATNRILDVMGLSSYEGPTYLWSGDPAQRAWFRGEEGLPVESEAPDMAPGGKYGDPAPWSLEETLGALLDHACENGLCEDSIAYRDLFDAKLMDCITPRPSEVIRDFYEKYYDQSSLAATDYFYTLSQDTDYIRRYRTAKDIKWVTPTKYGYLDITINLAKPEKDPKAIAAALGSKQGGYPKCQLCMENVGYAGRIDHPARNNHRVIPISIYCEEWGFQYSPYVYYNEHCIVFNSLHVPMKIDKSAFGKLFSFIEQFPHYFVGSNADLPIVGGSILTHEHFQGGRYTFAMERAQVEAFYGSADFPHVKAGVVHWPLSVLRLNASSPKPLIELADRILQAWREYTDEDAGVFAYTDGVPHNTITPIARKRGYSYELDLVLRNNLTTPEHPLGLYHPHARLHHIKKENIGLIEVLGLAILPARLKTELERLGAVLAKHALGRGGVGAGAGLAAPMSGVGSGAGEAAPMVGAAQGRDENGGGQPDAAPGGGEENAQALADEIRAHPDLEKHAEWALELFGRHPELCADNVEEILRHEVGIVFEQVLEDAGVYKCTPQGRAQFGRFLRSVGFVET
ncbi:MAG: UDP-glucose--hexose-1-phosphate uridylyltransferase [Lachnospiraceae bacterium]|jgi:UDPglucose--hexose-1-phosphate uridylyltransferase|nr:UDP-glucose--hexose-1-phosphate uridylyltransferase [Lachnospiraceae bacterium]